MAKEILVKRVLTQEMIDAGEELIGLLDREGLEVRTSFWGYLLDLDTWRLVIASPKVKTEGPRKVYKEIQAILSKMPGDKKRISIKDIRVVGTDDPLISSLNKFLKTGTKISRVSVTASAVGENYIDDALIYRST
jgi:hypothetical protein